MVKIVNSTELNTKEEEEGVGAAGIRNNSRHTGLGGLPKSVYQVHILSCFDLNLVLRYRSICRSQSLTVQEVIEYEIVCQKA